MEVEFLNELNESQRAAVEYCDGPSLVIAGAGSGKTRVLTYKIVYLLRLGLTPWSILALTFTNKAAREMRERIEKLVSENEARALWMGTFHSIFARILRFECEHVGYPRDYTIYDALDSENLVKQIIKEKGLDDKVYKPSLVAARISDAKNALIGPEEYNQDYYLMERDQKQRVAKTGEIYTVYQKRLEKSSAMDFDDLLLNTYKLLKNNQEIRDKYQQYFQFVLVDEYQDTNRVQHEIVKLLTERSQRVCVVGDDAQSIYSFRGAVVDNILDFQHLYPQTRLFKLERNYRSTQTIVAAAGSLIRHNRHQIPKDVYSENEQGEPIDVVTTYSDKEEASLVACRIEELKKQKGLGWGDFAVLYRTNSQSRTFEEAFRHKNISYRIVGGFSFYQRKEVKDVVAYLRLAVNPNDETALRRIINVPARGIGGTTILRLGTIATTHDITMWEVVSNPRRYSSELNAGICTRLTDFARMIEEAAKMAQEQSAEVVARYLIVESGLWKCIFQGNDPEDVSSQQYMQELMNGIIAWVKDRVETGESALLADYLQEISLLTELEPGEREEAEQEHVTLMTAHAAKGLEFPVVFVVGMEEGLFPSDRMDGERELEEERRLFYVALTRAKERVFITWSRTRFKYGQFTNCSRSRFLKEIDRKYLRESKPAGRSMFGSKKSTSSWATFFDSPKPKNKSEFDFDFTPEPEPAPVSKPVSQPTISGRMRPLSSVTSAYTAAASLPPAAAGLKVGCRICHARFGMGTVRVIEGTGLDAKVSVDFDTLGTKMILLRFSKFEIVD